MGEVFKAWDPRLERDVAVKLLHPETAANPDRQRRLVAEGRAVNDVVDVFGFVLESSYGA